jgi:hypothetical protein
MDDLLDSLYRQTVGTIVTLAFLFDFQEANIKSTNGIFYHSEDSEIMSFTGYLYPA